MRNTIWILTLDRSYLDIPLVVVLRVKERFHRKYRGRWGTMGKMMIMEVAELPV